MAPASGRSRKKCDFKIARGGVLSLREKNLTQRCNGAKKKIKGSQNKIFSGLSSTFEAGDKKEPCAFLGTGFGGLNMGTRRNQASTIQLNNLGIFALFIALQLN